MLIYHRKNQGVSRNFDHTNEGFLPIPSRQSNQDINFTWKVALVKDLLMVYLSILFSSLAYGIMLVLIAIRLEANVKNEILISISTITQIGAGVFFSQYLPNVAKKIGVLKIIIIASLLSALSAILLFKFFNFVLWIIVIYLLGTSLFTASVTRNTVMIDLAPRRIRSIIISVGATIVALGNAMGPIILNTLKTGDTFYSFLIVSALYVLAIFPLRGLKNVETIVREQKNIPIFNYIKNSPKIFFCGFTFSYIMSSCSTFCIIYGIRSGLNANEASMLLSSLLFGTIMYIPLGFLCNVFNRRFIIIFSAFCAFYVIYIINFYGDRDNIYLLFFLLFSLMSGLKLPTLVLINEKYKPTQRLVVNSAFTRVSLVGVICGLIATGICMKEFGYRGMWYSASFILALFIAFWLLNYLKKMIRRELSFRELTIFYKNYDKEEEL